jgi:hypothetical protein
VKSRKSKKDWQNNKQKNDKKTTNSQQKTAQKTEDNMNPTKTDVNAGALEEYTVPTPVV